MSKYSPIIIMGMHRSGTSMIAQILGALGLFTGKRKDQFHEAIFFHKINEWLLRQSASTWDYPDHFQDLLDHTELRALAVDYVRYLIGSPRVIGYTGLLNYLRRGGLAGMDTLWGWKDPRNTYTLPVWLEIFPGAKVIHIYRHGVDVANSLRAREIRRLARDRVIHDRRKRLRLYWLQAKRYGFANSLRCFSLEGGFSLWEAYMSEAHHRVQLLGNQAIEVRFEDFLFQPQPILKSLAQFCGLKAPDSLIERVTKEVRRDRAFAYRREPELSEFAGRMADRLAAEGY
jgi:hypothetical protein